MEDYRALLASIKCPFAESVDFSSKSSVIQVRLFMIVRCMRVANRI